MINIIGRVVDEGGISLKNVKAIALADWLLTTDKLSKAVPVDSDGQFVLQIESIDPADASAIAPVVPSFRVRVIDVVGRQLSADKVLDGTVLNHNLNNITVHRAEAEGLLVTNKSGTADFVSEGNAVKLLIDGLEAFGRVADEIERAEHSIDMTQLFFSLPPDFHKENEVIDPESKEPKEKPNLVFKFSPTPIEPIAAQPESLAKKPRIGDARPERLLLERVLKKKAIVRILLNDPTLGFPEGILLLALVVTPLIAGIGAGGVAGITALLGVGIPFFPLLLVFTVVAGFVEYVKSRKLFEDKTHVDNANHYFGHATASEDIKRLIIRGFRQEVPDQGVQHCKMVIVDNDRAVVIGSPFGQRYFDTLFHRIEEPRRGDNTSDVVHDLSIAVVGPAARDLSKSFRLYWDEDLPDNQKLGEFPQLQPNTQTSGEDDIATLQVVRTLSRTRFKKLPDGKSEKGILEGYLRAFAAAKHYIYLENQYFTDGVITDALVAALDANKQLQLIVVVPIKPDVLLYPLRQSNRIEQIREAGTDRVGVFTRWTYDKRSGNARPWVAPVYIHAKGAIVDDSWATIGSANLDGLSLDYNLLLSPLVFGETTACELNLNILPSASGAVTQFAQLMRRRLWSEHLGIVDATGNLNPEDGSLKQPPNHDWLKKLWVPKAKDALKHVTNATRADLPGFVLEYPKEHGGCLDTPRRHLAALGVELGLSKAKIRPITGSRKFHFSTGKWDVMPEREDVKL